MALSLQINATFRGAFGAGIKKIKLLMNSFATVNECISENGTVMINLLNWHCIVSNPPDLAMGDYDRLID